MLGLARAAGKIVLGFAKVDAALSAGRAKMLCFSMRWRPDGRAKLARKAQARRARYGVFFGRRFGLGYGAPRCDTRAVTEGTGPKRLTRRPVGGRSISAPRRVNSPVDRSEEAMSDTKTGEDGEANGTQQNAEPETHG